MRNMLILLLSSGAVTHLKENYNYEGVLGSSGFGLLLKVWHVPSKQFMAMKVAEYAIEYDNPEYPNGCVREAVTLMAIGVSTDPRAQHLTPLFEYFTVYP